MSKPGLANNENLDSSSNLVKGALASLFIPLVAAIAAIVCVVVKVVAAAANKASQKIGKKIDNFLLKEGPIASFVKYVHLALGCLKEPKSDRSAPPTYFIERQEEKETADVTGSTQLPNPPPESGVPGSSTSPCEVTELEKRRHTCSRS